MARYREWIRMVGGLIAGLILLLVVASISLVDDWQRDLTENFAETSATARNEKLRPLDTPLSVEELAMTVRTAASSLPRWAFVDDAPFENGGLELRFERSTRLWRFRDDITVRIAPTDLGSHLTASSRSRIGRGDLGQNPRNLAELLLAIRRILPEAA